MQIKDFVNLFLDPIIRYYKKNNNDFNIADSCFLSKEKKQKLRQDLKLTNKKYTKLEYEADELNKLSFLGLLEHFKELLNKETEKEPNKELFLENKMSSDLYGPLDTFNLIGIIKTSPFLTKMQAGNWIYQFKGDSIDTLSPSIEFSMNENNEFILNFVQETEYIKSKKFKLTDDDAIIGLGWFDYLRKQSEDKSILIEVEDGNISYYMTEEDEKRIVRKYLNELAEDEISTPYNQDLRNKYRKKYPPINREKIVSRKLNLP